MNLSFNLNCCALLKKLQGDDSIQNITPVNDAQFLIGKSWDASLRLNSSNVAEKHCTIEKVETSKWTVVVHENATVLLNDEVLPRGLPRLLEFNDKLRITSAISFHFKCSCMDGDDLSSIDNIDIQVAKRPKLSTPYVPQQLPPPQPPPVIFTEESSQLLDTQVPDDENLRSRYEQLVEENASLAARLKKAEEVAVFWENEKTKTDTCYVNVRENYNSIATKYSQLCKLKEESNCDLKYLRETVSNQTTTISRLQMQLTQLQQNYFNVENFKQNLENQNKQLNTDITVLRTKVGKSLECNKVLQRRNNELQSEVNGLRKDKNDLWRQLERKIKNSMDISLSKSASSANVSDKTYTLTSSAQNDLSDLLESEFKCSICDEVYIEAVVTNCAHMFCSYCIKSWKSIKPNCPICRSILTKEVKVLPVDSFLSSLMPFVTENLKTSWLKIIEERKAITAKESATATMKSTLHTGFPFIPPTPTPYGPSLGNSGNFHNVLMNVYRQIAHYSSFQGSSVARMNLSQHIIDHFIMSLMNT